MSDQSQKDRENDLHADEFEENDTKAGEDIQESEVESFLEKTSDAPEEEDFDFSLGKPKPEAAAPEEIEPEPPEVVEKSPKRDAHEEVEAVEAPEVETETSKPATPRPDTAREPTLPDIDTEDDYPEAFRPRLRKTETKKPVSEEDDYSDDYEGYDDLLGEPETPDQPAWLLGILLVLGGVTLFRLWALEGIGLGDAEAYYYAWSRDLSLGYYDHPPLVAWLIAWATSWWGETEIAVRLFSMVSFVVAGLSLGLFTHGVFRSWSAAGAAVLLFAFSPVFFLGGVAAAPDPHLMAGWMLAVAGIHRWVTEEKRGWLIPVAAGLTIALLAKYTAVVLPVLIVLYVLFALPRRFFDPSFWLAICLGSVLGILPGLVWNFEHDWAGLFYHLIDRHGGAGFDINTVPMFLSGQAAYLSPGVFVLGIVAFVAVLLRMSQWGRKNGLALFFLGWIPLLAFSVLSIWTPSSEPHWTVPGWLPLMAAGGYLLTRIRNVTNRKFAFVATVGLAAMFDLAAVVHITTDYGIKVAEAFGDPDWSKDITNELVGWDEIGREIQLKAQQERASFAVSYHYTMCGQLTWATRGDMPVTCVPDSPNRRDAFTFMTPPPVIGRNGIFVGDKRFDRDPHEVISCSSIRKLGTHPINRAGETVRKFSFYLCEGYRGPGKTVKPKPVPRREFAAPPEPPPRRRRVLDI